MPRKGARKGGSKMSQYEKAIAGYQQQQAKLRRQISALESGMGIGGGKLERDREATIRRTQRQIADLERAIMRLRERGST